MSAYQQGQADGLCGIYSLLNFLHRADGWRGTEPRDTLWYLLDGCRQLGWLNPYTLTNGFEAYQLKGIIDLQIANFRLSFESYLLSDVRTATKSGAGLIERIVAKGGSVVTGPVGKAHWYLITKRAGEIVIVDSDNPKASVRLWSKRIRVALEEEGLVILPAKRQPIVVEL